METLESKILNSLLEKYERSVLSKREAKVKREISLPAQTTLLEPYLKSPDPVKRQELEHAFSHLQRLGLLNIETNNGLFQRVILALDTEAIRQSYQMAKRPDPVIKEALYRPLLEPYLNSNVEVIRNFVSAMLAFLDQKEPEKAENYFVDGAALSKILLALEKMDVLEDTMQERDFSQLIFNDTKSFHSVRGKLSKIIRDFSGESFDEDEDVVTEWGVSKNKMYAYAKNGLVINVNGQVIDLTKYGEELPLSDAIIKKLVVVSSSTQKLMTVENLTSFYEMKDPDFTYIYLGGYHNKVRQSLIMTIAKALPNMSFYHFGDLDPDGFQILMNLRTKTGLPFQPYQMGCNELKKFIEFGKPMNAHDISLAKKELADSRYSEFFPVLRLMLEEKTKLEQEIISSR